VVLFVIGVVASSCYSTQSEQRLSVGQSMKVAAYRLTFTGISQSRATTESGTSVTTYAHLRYSGPTNGSMVTAQNQSSLQGIQREVGVRTDWWRAEDLYTILDSVVSTGPHATAYIIVEVEPLVDMVWIAGYLFVFGSLVAMWPDAREQRKLVTRLSLARA
jgi:cytochrome c biogenesis factor